MLNVTLAPPQRHRSLTVFPLVSPDAVELSYQLLVDALRAGTLRIGEVGSGTVRELLATNEDDRDVLILDGEQLIGARQNRMTNRSILLPGHSQTKIPVSCMEQGRWHFESESFSPSDQHCPSGVRRQARESEAWHAAASAPPPPEVLAQAQGAVWDSIAHQARALGVHSVTDALNDLYDARAADLDTWIRAFQPELGQIGLLAFAGERPLGMDLIGGRTLYALLHDRLLRGYIMDALQSPDVVAEVAPERGQRFLDRVRSADRVDSPTVGRGSYRVLTGKVIGGELVDGERIAHLSAFPARSSRPTGGGPIPYDVENPLPPPSQRRRRHL